MNPSSVAFTIPTGGVSEMGVNSVLAFIEAAEPKNEMEAALAIQMACTHAVAMAVLSRAGGAYGGTGHVAIMAAASARLLRAVATQVEAMRRLRSGGTQVIRIERVLSHPSLTGINSGTGLSGSAAWHNSVRARIYLKVEGDVRTLEFMKNQYGPLGESMVVRYENGVFVPDGGKTDVELAIINKLADDKFLELLGITAGQSRYYGANKGPNYAPTQLAKLPQAKGHNAKLLGDAMERLLHAGKIKLLPNPTVKPSKATLVLMRAAI